MGEWAVGQLCQTACWVSLDHNLVLGRGGSARRQPVSHCMDSFRFLEGLETAGRRDVDPKSAKHVETLQCKL